MNFRIKFLSLLVALSAITCTSLSANASPLKEILDSGQLKQKNRLEEFRSLSDPKWFTPGTNYSNLFTEKDGQDLLFSWMDKLDSSYEYRKRKSGKEKEFIFAEKTYRSLDRETVTTSVIVPHPKFIEMIELKLIPFFEDLPPKEYETKEVFNLTGVEWTAFKVNKHYCKALSEVAKLTKVIIEIKPCKGIDRVKKVAAGIDVLTINHKIQS
ncbi:MAG: hypothetical protein R3A13_09395 [Bdellovibrionota bacterium]